MGNYTLMFSRHASHVLAFKSGKKAFGMLQQNVQANSLDHVTVLNYGLSNANSPSSRSMQLIS